MTRWIRAFSISFGALGFLWSFLVLFAFTAFLQAAAGRAAILLLIPILGFIAGAGAVAGGIFVRERLIKAAWVALLAGLLSVFGPVAVLYLGIAGVTLDNVVALMLLTGWWGYGLILSGAIAIILSGEAPPQEEGPSEETPAEP